MSVDLMAGDGATDMWNDYYADRKVEEERKRQRVLKEGRKVGIHT